MTPVAVVAPGKLFVIGEYAVLSGARALVAAIEGGVRCVARPAAGWRLEAPDLGLDRPLAAAASHPGGALLVSAVDAALRRFGAPHPLHLHVEATRPALREKRGLGGSAASVVSIVGAIAALAGADLEGDPAREDVFRVARSVALAHQGGRGSGADVAASVRGGWIELSLDGGVPRVRRAAVPPGLALRAAWSGYARDTGEALAGWGGNGRLAAPLARFWEALEGGDVPRLLSALSGYGDALGFGEGPGGARIASLVAAAREGGAAAKGSGAVGGDCVIALAREAAALETAERRWRELGAEVVPAAIDTRGVRREDALV